MYSTRPNLLIGFHGCENSEMERLLESPTYIRKSRNDYDWLGHGMYFWEHSHDRAIEWAIQKKVAGSLKVHADFNHTTSN